MNKWTEAIETLQKSNELLLSKIKELKAARRFLAEPTKQQYYEVLENCDKEYRAVELAIEALKDAEARENPKPLTLDELRKRKGKPVWCKEQRSVCPCQEWGIVHDLDPFGDFMIAGTHLNFDVGTYGKWFAYDFEPKEGL